MKKRAFTLLELTFVILILGIVSSIAASVLSKIYETHLVQRSIHQISINTELAAEQIANRLQFSMPMLVVAREPGVANWNNVQELFNAPGADTTRTVLEWIAYDNDSFSAAIVPGWSGFADLNSSLPSPNHSIRTPGSDLNLTDTIIKNLSHNDVSTTVGDGKDRPNLIFSGDVPFKLSAGGGADIAYRTACLGLGSTMDSTCAIPITTTHFPDAHDRINFVNTGAGAIDMGEFYKIAWSAYALVPVNVNAAEGTFDLELHSNYQPWEAEYYTDPNTKKNMLIRNVTSFKFMESAGTLRFKLCARSYITGLTDFVTACKEKVISR